MPTPVSTARQCLSEEAARALDDAVAVARRRSHAQTTSLHALSALLSIPSSVLRDVCAARARKRLQVRALELCVGVSLDRLSSSKSPETENEPPVSNSLMAAIKRSQANQRRHPETYRFQQIHSSNQTTSVLKVELKYFILSILDDPIVSRVFEEAGFRSCDIKMAVIHPPVTHVSPRFTRFPPLFLCNLTDSDPSRVGFGYPLYDSDENCKIISEVMGRKEKKNPLLVGTYANDTLKSFTDSVQRRRPGFLPVEMSKLSVLSIEKEISELVVDGTGNKEEVGMKISELGQTVEQQCSKSSGLVVSLGELKVLISDSEDSGASLRCLVSKLTDLLRIHENKLWLIGSASSNETYSKVLDRFPMIQKDWDLHLLPITSSKPSCQGVYPKSSLMGSFVPFGGFFSSPSDFKTPFSSMNQTTPRCHLCNEKYQQEVAAVVRAGSNVSVADQDLDDFPHWLRVTEPGVDKVVGFKAKDDRIALNSQISALQEKWNDICQRFHQTPALPRLDTHPATPPNLYSPAASGQHPNSLKTQTANENRSLSPGIHACVSEKFPAKHKTTMPFASVSDNASFQSRLSADVSSSRPREDLSGFLSKPMANMGPIGSRTTSSSVTSVATNLGLGTLYVSTSYEPNTPKSFDQRDFGSNRGKPLSQTLHSLSCSVPMPGEHFNSADIKGIREILSRKVYWQTEAVNAISEIVSKCRAGLSSSKGVWLTFLGPDRIGKKKIASAIAEIIFGSEKSLISVDFGGQDSCDDKFRGKTVVEYLAGELARKPRSVVFLENVDNVELPDQISLSGAVVTGKLRDSHGREISTKYNIFLMTSCMKRVNTNVISEKNIVKFTEERILGAKPWKMQIKVLEVSDDARIGTNKRKLTDTRDPTEQETGKKELRSPKAQRSFLDLNLPAEEAEKDTSAADCESDAMSENIKSWLKDFFEKVDGNVVFKPFDFDGLAQKIEKEVFSHFHRNFGSDSQLEIDEDVIVQVVAAFWVADKERASVEDWVQNVLSASFAEARQRVGADVPPIVKLLSCTGCPMEERAVGINLPMKIDLI